MRIIAHRGASAYEPENTFRAFDLALTQGADWIELDVRLTADGHPVILHPADLEATTNGCGPVSGAALQQVRRLDAGSGERVPMLDEVVEHLGDRCGLYVELKAPGSPAALAEVLRRHRSLLQIVACSFSLDLVREVGELLPEVPTAWLSGNTEENLAPLARQVGADMVHLCWEAAGPRPDLLVTDALLAHYRDQGLEVVLWHEERPELLAGLLRMPVWGVCTNTPDVAYRLRQPSRSG